MNKIKRMIRLFTWIVSLSFETSCLLHQHRGAFRVIPSSPDYLLQSPDTRKTPFPDVLRTYNGFQPGQGSLDLRPLMELRIENAYYENGASRRGLTGFLGTEVARYQVLSQGLRLLSVKPMPNRPADQVPVQQLMTASKLQFPYYRLYFEIVFAQSKNEHGSVLLGAGSKEELDRLSSQLAHPEEVCTATSMHCSVFPEACSVSIEMKIIVNGKPQMVGWGSLLMSITSHPQHLEMKRLQAGRLTPLQIDSRDLNALRLPLLPGDQIVWN